MPETPHSAVLPAAAAVAAAPQGALCEVEEVLAPAVRVSGPLAVRLGPHLDRGSLREFLGAVDEALAAAPPPAEGRAPALQVDLGAVTDFDSAGLAALDEAAERARLRGFDFLTTEPPAALRDCLGLLSFERLTSPAPAAEQVGVVRRVGRRTLPRMERLGDFVRLFGACLRRITLDPLRGRPPRFDRCVLELDGAALGAMPITVLIAFLLGLVLAMQAWVQLRVFSAELLIANMVGVAVITEIGPLMTAIVLAARSASANAAQLGSMVVGEEIDALEQMGVDPQRFLVVPKVLALTLAAIALCLLFDLVAVCGAALFAWGFADTAPSVFRHQLELAVRPGDLTTAAMKCAIFGFCVGVVGCAEGLAVTGGSVGVGRSTTRAVVQAVFLIIVVDAIFVVLQRLVLA